MADKRKPNDVDLRKQWREYVPFSEEEDTSEDASRLRLFDENNPDINLFNIVDQELIGLGGSDMMIYKFETEDTLGEDDVYGEARLKKFYNKVSVQGHYEPTPIQEELSEFGIQLTNDQIFTFNRAYITAKLGRSLVPGDVVHPKFQNIMWEVFEVQEDRFDNYGVYHLICSARLLRDVDQIMDNVLG
jgi:hypothetical protein